MSLSKSKAFLTGVLLAVLSAITGSAMALDDMRLWKPYQPETFGGARRDNDGMYFSIDAIHWKVNRLDDIPKFYPILKEDVQFSVDVMRENGFSEKYNSLRDATAFLNSFGNQQSQEGGGIVTDGLDYNFSLGTRITLGKRRGHWGWQFRGYGISDIGSSINRRAIDWTSGTNIGIEEDAPEDSVTGSPSSRIDTDWYRFSVGITNLMASASITDLELMGTYRPHPFKWGTMELMAGLKYWDFKDKLSYHQKSHDLFYSFETDFYSPPEDTEAGAINSLVYQMENTDIRTVRNRITGPQLGFSVSRKNARWTFGADCLFIAGVNCISYDYAELSKFALYGVGGEGEEGETDNNTPVVDLLGYNDRVWVDEELGRLTNLTEQQLAASLAYVRSTSGKRDTYRYHKRRTVFSPGVDLNLSAKWQWTDAVGLKLGFNSNVFDNVARSGDITVDKRYVTTFPQDINGEIPKDEQGNDDLSKGTTKAYTQVTGTGSHNKVAVSYGVSFGIEIKR